MSIFPSLYVGAGVLAGLAISSGYDRWIDDPAVAASARSGYVLEAEKTALAAQLAQERQSRVLADQVTSEANKRAAAAVQAKRISDEKLEKAIAGDAGDDGARWGADDLDWLQLQRGPTR